MRGKRKMIIKNVRVYTEDKKFRDGGIAIHGGRFAGVSMEAVHADEGSMDEEIVDGQGCYAVPGLIDLHFHGCKGYDFCDGTQDAIAEIANYEASVGVTGICPATMTLPVEELTYILSAAATYKKKADTENAMGADLLGINMEGPFISVEKKGAQDGRNIIACDEEIARQFLEASEHLVKFIGVAPEKSSDALAFIHKLKHRVNLSLAHTNADYDTAMAAFDTGANHVVHLYNAMPAFTHRMPGVVGAVADSPHVMAELICDGVHIHPSVVRATFRMLGADRIILISDSMRATAMPDGHYTLGGLEVEVRENRAVLVRDGALAGSTTNLFDCMKTAVRDMGIPLEDAVACATANPAKALGVYGDYGSVAPGKRADLVLMDQELERKLVIKNGHKIPSAG